MRLERGREEKEEEVGGRAARQGKACDVEWKLLLITYEVRRL